VNSIAGSRGSGVRGKTLESAEFCGVGPSRKNGGPPRKQCILGRETNENKKGGGVKNCEVSDLGL